MNTTAPPSNSRSVPVRAAAALAAALVPVLAGLALLCSNRARRRAIALIGFDHTASAPAAQLGKLWGVGLLIIGALQALGSLTLGLSITDPAAALLRTLFALAAEALLLVLANPHRPEPGSGGLRPP
jgi:hypothetical protein